MRAVRDVAGVAALCAVLWLVPMAGCGGGGGGVRPPTLQSVSPTQGWPTGGTLITLTGTNLTSVSTVAVGGSPCTAVTPAGPTSCTALTPAGTAGTLADVAVTTAGGTATLTAAFNYHPAPTLTTVTPSDGTIYGGAAMTLTGTGFIALQAGSNTITVGGSLATNIVPLSDTQLSCTAPAGAPGNVTVSVSNLNGTASLSPGFRYFVPILLAEGGTIPPPPQFLLWAFDPVTLNTFPVGAIGFGVTAMDFAPDGTLYGTTAPGGSVQPPRQLVRINPATGAGTAVGQTSDVTGQAFVIPGVTFVGGTLYGTERLFGSFLSVNTSSALVTLISMGNPVTAGGAIAAVAPPGTTTYYLGGHGAPLYTVSTGTGAFTPGPIMTSATPGARFASACYHQGTLYALEALPGAGPRQLVTINTATGAATPVGPIHPSLLVNAMASPTR